MKKEGVLK